MFLPSLMLNPLAFILDSSLSFCKLSKAFLPLSRTAVKAYIVSLTFHLFCNILQVVISTSWAKLEEDFERKDFSSLLLISGNTFLRQSIALRTISPGVPPSVVTNSSNENESTDVRKKYETDSGIETGFPSCLCLADRAAPSCGRLDADAGRRGCCKFW